MEDVVGLISKLHINNTYLNSMKFIFALALTMLVLSSTGQTLDWANGATGAAYTIGRATAVDSSGNSYVTGLLSGTADFDPVGTANLTGNGGGDIFIAKYDPNGALIWAKHLNGGSSTSEYTYAIEVDQDQNFIIAGSYEGTLDFDPSGATLYKTSEGSYDLFLAKYTPNGDVIWANSMGGLLLDWGSDIALDQLGNIYITGGIGGWADFDPGPGSALIGATGAEDAILAKYDKDGNYRWSFSVGGGSFERGNALGIDDSANLYMAGYYGGETDFDPGIGSFDLNTVNKDIFVAKYDSSGAFTWAIGMGGGTVAGVNCEPYDIAVNGDGDFALTGIFWGTADFDPSAATVNVTPETAGDIFIGSYHSNGSLNWVRNIGGSLGITNSGEGRGVTLDANNNIYVTGYFRDTTDLDPGVGTNIQISQWDVGGPIAIHNFRDVFVMSLSKWGGHRWGFRIGGMHYEEIGYDFVIENDSTIFVSGSYGDSAEFDPSGSGGLISNLSASSTSSFLAKYSMPASPVTSIPAYDIQASLYPNPTNNAVTISFDQHYAHRIISLIGLDGQFIKRLETSDALVQLDLSEHASGMYLVRIQENKRANYFKVIKR